MCIRDSDTSSSSSERGREHRRVCRLHEHDGRSQDSRGVLCRLHRLLEMREGVPDRSHFGGTRPRARRGRRVHGLRRVHRGVSYRRAGRAFVLITFPTHRAVRCAAVSATQPHRTAALRAGKLKTVRRAFGAFLVQRAAARGLIKPFVLLGCSFGPPRPPRFDTVQQAAAQLPAPTNRATALLRIRVPASKAKGEATWLCSGF